MLSAQRERCFSEESLRFIASMQGAAEQPSHVAEAEVRRRATQWLTHLARRVTSEQIGHGVEDCDRHEYCNRNRWVEIGGRDGERVKHLRDTPFPYPALFRLPQNSVLILLL